MQVKKRNGQFEDFDENKIHKVIQWACEGLRDVSVSDIEMKSNISFYDGISTEEINEAMIKSSASLITLAEPDYQIVAGRLINYAIRKNIWGGYNNVPNLSGHIDSCVNSGYYTKDLLEFSIYCSVFFPDLFHDLNEAIDHSKDDQMTYIAMEQMRSKYLVKDRRDGKSIETPQFLYMTIAIMTSKMMYKFLQKQLDDVSPEYYEKMKYEIISNYQMLSDFVITLPTPIMAGLRTPVKQFSSCVVLETDDSLESMGDTAKAILKYVSQKAGIGLNVGRIRSANSIVRNGDALHTGIRPFIRFFESAVNSCSQGAIRTGSATVYFPIWHPEIQDIIVLKNNKGSPDARIRKLDYAVQINKTFYQRLIEDKDISLFDPHDCPDLYEAFFKDAETFTSVYEWYEENHPELIRNTVKASDLFANIVRERKETGRLYIMNVDNTNTHTSFKEPIHLSNLCLTGDAEVETNLGTFTLKELAESGVLEKYVVNIKSFDTLTGQIVYKRIRRAFKTYENNDDLYRLSVVETHLHFPLPEKHEIRCTGDHMIYTANRGWVKAREIVDEDKVIVSNLATDITGVQERECKIKKTLDVEDVYDLTVDDTHSFFANGILVHNCTEIALPTTPLSNDAGNPAEINLCTLGGINMAKISEPNDFLKPCFALVNMLTNIILTQEYPVKEAEYATLNRRPLGIGWNGLATFLAQRGLKYDSNALPTVHEYMEKFAAYLTVASVDATKVYGKVPFFDRTNYADNVMPWELFLDKDGKRRYEEHEYLDWSGVKELVEKYGMANSCLMAFFPGETSSQVAGGISNGVEPIRSEITFKQSKDGSFPLVAMPVNDGWTDYDKLWEQESPRGYLEIMSVIQKYCDQAISANTSYNPSHYEGGKIPFSVLIKDIMYAYSLGLKTLYYYNEGNTGNGDSIIEDADDCDSCKV